VQVLNGVVHVLLKSTVLERKSKMISSSTVIKVVDDPTHSMRVGLGRGAKAHLLQFARIEKQIVSSCS
jgi:hypothetical protein